MYEEIDHTADYAIHVRGIDLPCLFIEAARGMNALTGGVAGGPAVSREIHVEASELEALLVTWLEELAFLMETAGEMYKEFEVISLSPTSLRVRAQGGSVSGLDKLIKAITFHDLAIRQTTAGYETTVVFDV
jgi:SHS2 domain-containing protein